MTYTVCTPTWRCTTVLLSYTEAQDSYFYIQVTHAHSVTTKQEQWRRYTRTRQVIWPGWKIHRPGSALLSHVYCFASVIVWTENKNVTISDRFICFILTVKRRWWPVFWGRQLRKGRQLFLRKKCIRVTWLEDFLTSKWPGSFTVPEH